MRKSVAGTGGLVGAALLAAYTLLPSGAPPEVEPDPERRPAMVFVDPAVCERLTAASSLWSGTRVNGAKQAARNLDLMSQICRSHHRNGESIAIETIDWWEAFAAIDPREL